MTAGLFAMSCPECGGELTNDQLGTTSTCAPCQRTYLHRFGHLIPVEFHQFEPESVVITLSEPESAVHAVPLG